VVAPDEQQVRELAGEPLGIPLDAWPADRQKAISESAVRREMVRLRGAH
jgi:hypothetical protein